MIFYSQLDPQWALDKIGNTNLTIGRWGCCLSSVCTAISKAGGFINPPQAAKKWKFTSDGLLCWDSDFSPLKFSSRCAYDPHYLKSWLDKGGYAVVQVDGFHWLMADRFGLFGLYCVDPLGGKSIRPLTKYHKLTGMALFVKA
jgi:hypothetical protein